MYAYFKFLISNKSAELIKSKHSNDSTELMLETITTFVISFSQIDRCWLKLRSSFCPLFEKKGQKCQKWSRFLNWFFCIFWLNLTVFKVHIESQETKRCWSTITFPYIKIVVIITVSSACCQLQTTTSNTVFLPLKSPDLQPWRNFVSHKHPEVAAWHELCSH